MPAYSGGNRWVGVVSLIEPPVAVPLHKMAAIRQSLSQFDHISVAPGQQMPVRQVCRALQRLAERHALGENWGRAAYYFDLSRTLSRQGGGYGELPGWVGKEILDFTHRPAAGSRAHLSARTRRPARNFSAPRRPEPSRRVPAAPPQRTRQVAQTAVPRLVFLPPQRDIVIVDDSDRPVLGDPGEWADRIPLSDALAEELEKWGWSVKGNTIRERWIRIASMHTSYLYENNGRLLAPVNGVFLRAIEEVGRRWVKLSLLDCYTAKHHPAKVGQQSSEISLLGAAINKYIDDFFAPLGFTLLGKGEAAQAADRPSRAFSNVNFQVIGVIALLDGIKQIHRFVRSAYDNGLPSIAKKRDWRTLLEQQVQDGSLTWLEHREGPDHDVSFQMTVSDPRGRKGVGAGRSKKEASQRASEDFLRKHIPQALKQTQHATAEAGPPPGSAPSRYLNPPREHWQAVCDLRRMFDLPPDADPWLMQALTHSSWTYENKERVTEAGQRDNALLAHHGSSVAETLTTHELVLRMAAHGFAPTEDAGRTDTLSSESCAELFELLELKGSVLLGKGQASNPDVARADVSQALLAVAWRFRRNTLLERRPKQLHEFLTTHTPVLDPYSKLQAMSAMYGIELESSFYEEGLEHDRSYAVDIEFRSGDDQFVLECDFFPGSKANAKKKAVDGVLSLLSSYSDDLSQLNTLETDLLAFYLWQQITNVDKVPRRHLMRCVLQRHLGMDYLVAGDSERFTQWAEATEQLVGSIPPETVGKLTDFYSQCLAEVYRGSTPGLREELLRLADWIQSLHPEMAGSIQESPGLTRLALLSTVLSSTTQPSSTDLPGLLSRIADEHSASLTVDPSLHDEDVFLQPQQIGALGILLNRAASASAAHGHAGSIEATSMDDDVVVLLSSPETDIEGTLGPVAELMAEIAPSITCYLNRHDIIVKVSKEAHIPDSGMAHAGLTAMKLARSGGRILPELHHLVADIHESVVAFESARSAAVNADRTTRYLQLAEASEHLDAAEKQAAAIRRLAASL
ncbi:hypothetical protein GCM10010466_08600 [Planomonospora alba]|uniref:DRBM domain-containing protein n=1 Tax=Planomonospora alba TaxID=161354 RepID=A0ABP6MN07_9ACTN